MKASIKASMTNAEKQTFRSFFTFWDNTCHAIDGDCKVCPFYDVVSDGCTNHYTYLVEVIRRFQIEDEK